MLQQICEHLHNMFVTNIARDTYTIAGDMIHPDPALKEGQRFLIAGSDLNDGVYTYSSGGIMNDDDDEAAGLANETFYGAIEAMSVPPALTALARDVKAWVEKYGAVTDSPYTSESFGGYSYTKAAADASGNTGWQSAFAAQLNRWRKVSF